MEQVDVLRHAVQSFEALNVAYMVVGSIASMAYGEPRLTRDIDLVADLRESAVAGLCDAFPGPEFYVSRDAVHTAVRNRHQFKIVHPASGNKLDVVMPRNDAWGHSELSRRRTVELVPGLFAYVASPEDIILAKMVYYHEGEHEKHLRDIAAMLQLSGSFFDLDYIHRWSKPLGLEDIWQTLLKRLDAN